MVSTRSQHIRLNYRYSNFSLSAVRGGFTQFLKALTDNLAFFFCILGMNAVLGNGQQMGRSEHRKE